ncbi:glycoside hydrolase family 3 N-terminal domain-containing protein [Halosimplex amylolyticum]|uniref:glycoside hydrolase family 3 N-terminal domain-containing protein n=1 Tax=Halosimplex amylolyticum TaxID=3396616 RepID=UPI003F56A857
MPDRSAFGQRLADEDERRVEAILDEMTVAEKVGQIVGVPALADVDEAREAVTDHHVGSVHFGGTPHNTPAEKAEFVNELQRAAIDASRFDVPLFVRAMAEHGHAAISGSTVFPQQLGLGATRDPDLAARAARVAAVEMRATGVQSTSSPIGDVARDQRWGRIAETFGESPHLCGEFTAAMVRGYQENDCDDSVLAVTKHFPAYSEGVRGEDQAPNDISEYTLRRVHVPPYEAGIEAGTAGIMPCYNVIDGEPVHGSPRFLRDLLREDLGFTGFTLADYAGAEDLHGGHRATESLEESLWRAVHAGIDLLPSGGAEYCEHILALVEDGELSESRIEESARRVLRLKFALDLFEDPFVDPDDAVATLGRPNHRELAREVARESMTLLRNEGDVLPLDPDLDQVLVAGPNADDIAAQHGGWGSVEDPRPLGDTVLDGIEAAVADGTDVVHERGAGIDETLDVDAARDAAEQSDAAVVVVGEPDYVHEFRASSQAFGAEEFPHRERLTLPEAQRELVEAIHATGTPTVAVLVTGRVLSTPWIAEHVPGLLLAYQPGSEGGAVADVLFGEHDPSGRLPLSVPRSEGQVPVRFNHLTHPTVDHEAHRSSYDPLFEYGHGLSYTDFEYEDLSVSPGEVGPDATVDVEVTVANVGDRAGTEPVEVFATDVVSTRVTPVRELRAFDRVDLDAGDRATVSFSLDVRDFGIVENDGTRTVEPGTFEVRVGDLVESFEVARGRPYRR